MKKEKKKKDKKKRSSSKNPAWRRKERKKEKRKEVRWREKVVWVSNRGSHKVTIFTIMPLKLNFQLLKTPIWCFRFSSLSLNPNWVWVMKTGLGNQSKHSKLCGSHVILKLSYECPVIWLKTALIQTGPKYPKMRNITQTLQEKDMFIAKNIK